VTSSAPGAVRILFVCSGLGIMNRGIESFFREAFDGLKATKGLDLRLARGGGPELTDEWVLWSLPRTGRLARGLGAITRRNGYVVEQWSSLFSAWIKIRRFKPDAVFYSDANLGFLLFWLRRRIAVPYTLLFSNGGPVHPPFIRTDYVHQVAPCYYEEALSAGESPGKHFLVPYGIEVGHPPEPMIAEQRNLLRHKLGIPPDRKVVLSVGWISREHKRMDYLIEEVARLPGPRPFLQLLGAIDESSAEILELGRRLLGPKGFAATSVSYERVFEYYRAADLFVLASLREGFGRVYLEALMHGLAVIAHFNPITEYVLGTCGILGDLRRPGVLAQFLAEELRRPRDPRLIRDRWQSVRDRFNWPVLAPAYREMFHACAFRGLQTRSGVPGLPGRGGGMARCGN
jgi:1,2-diacylglycerol 3-alpha-glucosyltransferase